MGLLYIFVIPSDPHAVKLLFKLVPMGLIIVYAYLNSPAFKERYSKLILIGLFFCMLGDGLLGMFVVGLSAFLIGHIFYFAAFVRRWRYSKTRFAAVVPIFLFALFMGWKLMDALAQHDKGALMAPVLAYLIVISSMAWTAIMSGQRWAITGALLFVASDSILSWNLFVSDIAHSGTYIMTTYYAAQFLLAYSLLRSPSHRTNVSFYTA
ncbi:lysoplasmalogenase [Cohnella endophytica]|uniref:Lysoplasmalogenase n=2 Tax=Cohnella endophytica TaxID=2419778 RepID=A0A494XVW3_9BACL|nr:lysoplasmalogenase [Cohnella endophytica]